MSSSFKTMFSGVLLSRFEVLELSRMSKSKLHADIASNLFPAPLKIGARSYFVGEEIQDWLAQRIAERDANVALKIERKAAA